MTDYSYNLIILAIALASMTVWWAWMLYQEGVFIVEAAFSGVAVGYLILQVIKQIGAKMHRWGQKRGMAHE